MFSSIKIGLILVMLAGAGGGYLYVQKLQKDNAILKENTIKLETAVEDQKGVIEQQTKDLKQIRNTLKKVEELNTSEIDLETSSERLSKVNDAFSKAGGDLFLQREETLFKLAQAKTVFEGNLGLLLFLRRSRSPVFFARKVPKFLHQFRVSQDTYCKDPSLFFLILAM
mgnify:CR=1 FL=1